MSYSQYNIMKCLCFLILLIIVLYFFKDKNQSQQSILGICLVAVFILFLLYCFISQINSQEGMVNIVPHQPIARKLHPRFPPKGTRCGDNVYEIPKQVNYSDEEQDLLDTGLDYNYDLPNQGSINYNDYTSTGIPYSDAQDLICQSKFHKLYQQHNFNIIWSPHTFIGKARGYLNWDKTYD